jgi:protein subunit release factor B
VSLVIDRLEGKNSNNNNSNKKNNLQQKIQNKIDPKLLFKDEDLTETFVRGSGAGGQKVNKTSNRVVLVHEPTQLRVECQDTRSLQQNRKIARKRLLGKLDDHWNGSQSKLSMKNEKASGKKQKSKTKNRARQRTKQLEKQQPNQEEEEE